jgi:hypothetical protein
VGSTASPLTCTVDKSARPVGDRPAAHSGPTDGNHGDQLAHASERPAGELGPAGRVQDECGTPEPADLLATLIEQLQENWDHGDNAANDDVVMRIREHIRRQQAAAPGPRTSRGG